MRLFKLLIIVFVFYSCKSSLKFHRGEKVIYNSCVLKEKINDTVVLSGNYFGCMEGYSFVLDDLNCSKKYLMDLDFESITVGKKLNKRFDELFGGCVTSMNMILKGVFITGSKEGYGHLGENNSKLIVIEVIDFGKVEKRNP